MLLIFKTLIWKCTWSQVRRIYVEQASGRTLDKLNSVKITQKDIQKAKILKGKSEYMFQGAVYRP